MQKEEIAFPVRCSGDAFQKMFFEKYRSIPIGRILRLERRGCRFESCLLYEEVAPIESGSPIQHGLSCSKAGEKHLQCFCEEFDSLTGPLLDPFV